MLVAFSGGPDSTALLLGLHDLGIPVVAAHFDHALRAGSSDEAERAAELCRRLGVELIRGRRERPLDRGSVQAAARRARYEFLFTALEESGLDAGALGHTADDLVESVLMNLLRGSGLAGMRGMPERHAAFRRPLLNVWRSEVEAYLRAKGARPIRDPSNRDLRYARVRVRLQLLPQLERDRPGLKLRLHRASRRAAAMHDELERQADGVLQDGRAELARLRASSAALQAQVFRRLHADLAGRRPGLEADHLAALRRLLRDGRSGDRLDLPGGVAAVLGYHFLEMSTGRAPSTPGRLLISDCPGCASPVAAHFMPGASLELRHRRPGLRMRPLPAGRTRKLQDILVDAKVPRHLRDSLPLVFADGELAWVPGVAMDARQTRQTALPGLHAELGGAQNPLLESRHQLKESAS